MSVNKTQRKRPPSLDGEEIEIVIDLHNGKGPMRASLRTLTREMDLEPDGKSISFIEHIVGKKYPVRVMLVDDTADEEPSKAALTWTPMFPAIKCMQHAQRRGKKRSRYVKHAIGDLLKLGSHSESLTALDWLTRSDMDALKMDTCKVGQDMSNALNKLSGATETYERT